MDILRLQDAGRQAIQEYLQQKSVSTGNTAIDSVLEGGIEAGNFYLWLGASKSGKSTTLRALGLSMAKNFPVLYVNFEQLGRNVFAKLYEQQFKVSLREEVHKNPELSFENILKMPDRDFYIAFWTDKLENKAFNAGVREKLMESVEWMRSRDMEKRTPVIIMENLSDIYNERVGGGDNLVNVVTQTAQDIKNFCISNELSVFLAHHSGKLAKGQTRPTMDDVRDSKRVVDLAHSIFTAFTREECEKGTDRVIRQTRHLAYLAGRGSGEYHEWEVSMDGLTMNLT